MFIKCIPRQLLKKSKKFEPYFTSVSFCNVEFIFIWGQSLEYNNDRHRLTRRFVYLPYIPKMSENVFERPKACQQSKPRPVGMQPDILKETHTYLETMSSFFF